MASAIEGETTTGPSLLAAALRRADRRVRVRSILRSGGRALLLAGGGAALGMIADVAYPLPAWLRWSYWLAWVSLLLGGLGSRVIRHATRPIARTALAVLIERQGQERSEHLSCAIGLMERGADAGGSPELIAAAIRAADQRVHPERVSRAVPLHRALALGLAGVAIAGLVFVPALVGPPRYATIARRFLAPWSQAPRIGRFVVDALEGDRGVAKGSDVTLTVRARPGFLAVPTGAAPIVDWVDALGRRQRSPMARVAGASTTWALTLPRLERSIRYRAWIGPESSAPHRITVVEPPYVEHLSAVVEPPPYMNKPATRVDRPQLLSAWEGSAVTFTITPSSPLRDAWLAWPGADGSARRTRARPIETAGPARRTWIVLAQAVASGRFHFELTDAQGIGSEPELARRVVVKPDAPPTVAFLAADDGLTQTSPSDLLVAAVLAEDDLGLAGAEMHYAIERFGSSDAPEQGKADLDLPGLGTNRARGDARLDLARLGLRPGDVVEYRVRVLDTRPVPNEAWTAPRRLSIVAQAESLLSRREGAEMKHLRDQLDSIRRQAAANQRTAEELRYAADAARREGAPWSDSQREALEASESGASEVVDRLEALARELAEGPRRAEAAQQARSIAENEAEAGREALEKALDSENAGDRLEALKQADQGLAATQRRLDALRRRLNAPGSDASELARDRAPNPENRSPTSAPGGTGTADLTELGAGPEEGRGRAWGQLPGHLRTAILQMAQRPLRPEYADLIRRYYREIAAGAVMAPDAPSAPERDGGRSR